MPEQFSVTLSFAIKNHKAKPFTTLKCK